MALPLAAAGAAGVALVVLSVVLPVVTTPNGRVGPQPRETLVAYLGPRGVLPAVALLAVTAAVALLLRARTRTAIVAARVLASLLLAATLASVVAFHLVGLATVPVGALLLAAAFGAEPVAPTPRPQATTGVT